FGEGRINYGDLLEATEFSNPLELIQKGELNEGVYIFDNLLDFEHLSQEARSVRESQLYNCASRLEGNPKIKLILLGEWISLSSKLRLKLKQIDIGLPNRLEIAQFLEQTLGFSPETKLTTACQGLAWGDIHDKLKKFSATDSVSGLTEALLNLKQQKLNNSELNLEYFAKPDIPSAGGNENLSEFLNQLATLNEPGALRYGIRPPKAMLFVGPPGTGKSLRAKLIARDLGYTLLGISFGDILGSNNPDRTVWQLWQTAESLGNVILFLDDWDKGLADWESGGVSRRIVQKFLTRMQEHNSSIITIATVNRIELFPIELLRRFDSGGIWLIDLPNRGEIFAIFNIYLAKHFPEQFSFNPPNSVTWSKKEWLRLVEDSPWSMEQWVSLIDESEDCTPVEISDVVTSCLNDWYCSLSDVQRLDGKCAATLNFDHLLKKLSQLEKASARSSESIQAMRNRAWFARPASKPDTSPFEIPAESLLGGGK
ncbi:MAG: AAA family ATPase, partial [Cyanobacteria bacterium J06558_2]